MYRGGLAAKRAAPAQRARSPPVIRARAGARHRHCPVPQRRRRARPATQNAAIASGSTFSPPEMIVWSTSVHGNAPEPSTAPRSLVSTVPAAGPYDQPVGCRAPRGTVAEAQTSAPRPAQGRSLRGGLAHPPGGRHEPLGERCSSNARLGLAPLKRPGGDPRRLAGANAGRCGRASSAPARSAGFLLPEHASTTRSTSKRACSPTVLALNRQRITMPSHPHDEAGAHRATGPGSVPASWQTPWPRTPAGRS